MFDMVVNAPLDNGGFFHVYQIKLWKQSFIFCSVINVLAVAILVNGPLLRRIKVTDIFRRFNQH